LATANRGVQKTISKSMVHKRMSSMLEGSLFIWMTFFPKEIMVIKGRWLDSRKPVIMLNELLQHGFQLVELDGCESALLNVFMMH